MSLELVIAFMALGAVGGFLAGLLGIGGGLVLVPFFTYFFSQQGFPSEHVVHMAIGTAGATILFTSLSSVRAHHRKGAVMWPVVWRFVPGLLVGTQLGALVADQLKTPVLAAVFAGFVGFSAIQMYLDKKPNGSRELPATAGMFGVSSLIGLLSSLVGAGGGFISVPFMTWCNVKIHQAVATSAALGFPIAAGTAIGYIWHGLNATNLPSYALGYVYLPALACVVAASVTTAPIGAGTAHRLPVKTLKRVFAFVLFGLASYMLYKAYVLR
ncbi:sulfite exporter TauE/SafE family protein [Parvibium lacunae]|uniref:Probable membrane transporter protein n=1 Tax=Parvibium lacunae TaxID=1888893 RepID=A0A368L877_9BURK|nr:sulfite exporter TauE/SafE family protein [Parvibium lacunae]RCS59880.1 sulfite exporter TauE/SafE family protein [Parvibium lacunae]